MIERLGGWRVRVGKLVLTDCTQAPGAPIIDGGGGRLLRPGDQLGPTYGAVVVCPRPERSSWALVLGWVGAGCPDPGRWWPPRRALQRRLRLWHARQHDHPGAQEASAHR